jgi:hypothetical protein
MKKPFDHQALLSLWNITEIPACEKGMKYAEAFLIAAGDGVNALGTEDPETRVQIVTEAYMELVTHGIDCDDCNETETVSFVEPNAPNDELPERDDIPRNPHEHEAKFLEDRKLGFEAGLDGVEMDETKTAAWQSGWADAQE